MEKKKKTLSMVVVYTLQVIYKNKVYKMYLGACDLHRTLETFFQQPLVNGFTPPLNFPVTW